MKLRISATFIACLIAGCLISSYASGSGTKAIGNILLKNGQQLDSITFEMPCVADTQVKIITDGQKHMLDTDSIDSIILWDKRYPDRKYMFKPFRSEIFEYKTEKITGISDSPVWLCCEQVEENASYWVEIGRPSFKKQKIQFNFSSRSYPSVYYVLKRGSEHPSRKPDKTKDVKKWVKVYFNDDPEVMRKFEAGEYDASDWGYKYVDVRRIISEYKPLIK